jgi:hypothetical protein
VHQLNDRWLRKEQCSMEFVVAYERLHATMKYERGFGGGEIDKESQIIA